MPVVVLIIVFALAVAIFQALGLGFAFASSFVGHPAILTTVVCLLGGAIGLLVFGDRYGLERELHLFRQPVSIALAMLSLFLGSATVLGFLGYAVVRPVINHAKWAEEERMKSFIQATHIARQLDSNNRPIRPGPTLQGPTSPVYVMIDYRNAKSSSDEVIWRVTGPRVRSQCGPVKINRPQGSHWCHWEQLHTGNYRYEIFVNGKIRAQGAFQIR